MRIKGAAFLIVAILLFSCHDKKESRKVDNKEAITSYQMQDSLFNCLRHLINPGLSIEKQIDTIGFLVLPLDASCPACRDKTIDSIVKYQNKLDEQHFVIITGNGRKSISHYFEVRASQMPETNKIFYDTTGFASKFKISGKNPSLYYSINQKVYCKVTCKPSTIRGDLRTFFENL